MSARLHVSGDEAHWAPAPAHYSDVHKYDTTVKLLLNNAENFPDAPAQRQKDYGVWNAYTWRQVCDHVARMALALKAMGVGKGDVVAIIGDNRPFWVWAELAAHAVGAMSMGIYRDALESEIEYLLAYAKPKAVFAEDEEQIDKFLSLGDRIPSVERIIYEDKRGMRKYVDPRLADINFFEQIGEAALKAHPKAFEELADATQGEDVAILCTTSGTTSNPKLSMWKHRALLSHAAVYLRADPREMGDEYLSVLPLSWVMEQMYAVAWNLVARMVVNFPESPATTMHDLREIGPHFALLAPRVWEQIAADVRARMMDSKPWKQKIYDWGVKTGIAAIEKRERSGAADALVFRPLRDRLGFSHLKSAATGGAAMGPETFKFFLAMGAPLKQLYGQTEGMGAYTIHKPGEVDHETVGQPMPGCEIRIKDPDSEGLGEICVRHPNMMSGYYLNEKASRETFDAEGWFLTGDAGRLTDKGHLVVIDRIKDLAETSKGVRFSPQFIENKLKFSPYVAEAVILGAGRPHLAALICIRYGVVSKWAEQRRIAFTTYSDLSARPEVYEVLRTEVERVNATVPEAQRIRKFALLYKELDADDGELTRTRKVKRGVIAEKYADIIEGVYSGAPFVKVDTVIHFQDGGKQRIQTQLKIETPREGGAA